MRKTYVIHHSADYDGIFCREIARKFLPEAELIGWDYGDPLPIIPKRTEGGDPGVQLYMLDISVDGLMDYPGLIWIDHHKSAIEKYDVPWIHNPAGKDSFGAYFNEFWRRGHETRTTPPPEIPGYRIDGVAACRLAWQWFTHDIAVRVMSDPAYLPDKLEYVNREVSEPLAVQLAGCYDVWQHDEYQHDIAFQFGLDSEVHIDWNELLSNRDDYAKHLVLNGCAAMQCYAKRDADVMRSRSFLVEFDGVKFLALNTARCNSITFAARDVPETGHDGLLAFYWTGKDFSVSLYHAAHRKDLDLSLTAVKHGGGGHRGACGFRSNKLPFLP